MARQNIKLDSIQVVERFTRTDEPQGRFVEAKSVDWLGWKVTEEDLHRKLVSGNGQRGEERKPRINDTLCERRDEDVAAEMFQQKL